MQETEKRLKDIVHGNRKATGGVNGLARKTALQQRAGNRLVVTVRLCLFWSILQSCCIVLLICAVQGD